MYLIKQMYAVFCLNELTNFGDLVANWPDIFKVKNMYLLAIFVFLHVFDLYVECLL